MIALRTFYHNKLQEILTETEAGNGTLRILFLRARGDRGAMFFPCFPSWEVHANPGLTAAVLTGSVGPGYLSVCPNLTCSTNATFVSCPKCTRISHRWQHKSEETKHVQSFQRWGGLGPEARVHSTAVSITMPVATETFVNGLGGLPETLTLFPKSSIINYIKWPKSKLLLFYKNLSITIADLNFSQFSYKKISTRPQNTKYLLLSSVRITY